MSGEDKDREAELRRILERVDLEAEVMGRQARPDTSAEDADKEDRAQYWRKRIVWGLGVLLLIGLVAWMFLYFMGE